MANARTQFDAIAELMQRDHDATVTQLYKQPCILINATPFICYVAQGVAFRLRDRAREQALALPGASLWAPLGEPAPMSAWVLVPIAQFQRWESLALEALHFAADNTPASPLTAPSTGAPSPPPAAQRWEDKIDTLLEQAAKLRLER